MKKLAFHNSFCLFALMFFAVNNSNAQNLSAYNLVGKVKEMRQYHYVPLEDCDYCEDLKNDSTLISFDSEGKELKQIEWNTGTYRKGIDNFIKAVKKYKYDAAGKVSTIEINVDDDGFYTQKYFRDTRGYIIRIETYLRRTDEWWHQYWWRIYVALSGGDEQNLLRAKDYTENEIKKEIEKSKKEDDGLVEIVYRKNNDNGTGKDISTYGCYGIDKTKTIRERKFCDDNGWTLKSVSYYDGKETSNITYSREFYATGTLSKSTAIFSDGRKEMTTYNEKGLCTLLTEYYENKKTGTTTYTYTYDNFGNWITMKITKNGKITDIYKRKISYYK
ncbi:MAG: hypothetical protein J6U04_10675 [Salinivirgaceae bacterium]|nr:hypothetical protein [Salinivirgaceae bacterium]